jgi:hypothetical protein
MSVVAGDAADSDTPLRAVFKINLNGKTVSIATVGQAYALSPISAQSNGSSFARCTPMPLAPCSTPPTTRC